MTDHKFWTDLKESIIYFDWRHPIRSLKLVVIVVHFQIVQTDWYRRYCSQDRTYVQGEGSDRLEPHRYCHRCGMELDY